MELFVKLLLNQSSKYLYLLISSSLGMEKHHYLLFCIMCLDKGPSTHSIIARCSLLLWVWREIKVDIFVQC